MGKRSDIVSYVRANIQGRIASKIGERETGNVEVLLDFVEKAGEGNYLEIGTLFGGSAIPVALLKNELLQRGLVFCVDPLDGYYRKYASREDMMDLQSRTPVTVQTLFNNIAKFNVGNRIVVLREYSTSLAEFIDMKFAVSYIDGDHRGGVPLRDWNLIKNITTKFVVFDNCADTHPDVHLACKAANDEKNWRKVYHKDITFVVERI